MQRLLNTLYITTPESYLYLENAGITIKIGGETKAKIPLHGIDSIVCFGKMTVSTPLIAACGQANIGLTFLSEYGKFLGRVYGPVSGNVLLRRAQNQRHENAAFCLQFAKNTICGKLVNAKHLLMRCARDRDSQPALQAAQALTAMVSSLEQAPTLDILRGIEGAAASLYFSVFDEMLSTRDASICFHHRSRRPPENEVNATLSFLYTLQRAEFQSALEQVGLDPAIGFFHALRPGRPALALDMMEELRAPLCDRMTIALFNRGQLTSKDFSFDAGGCMLEDKGRKIVLENWQARKREIIVHPYLKEKIPIGLIPHVQSQLLARVIRGDMEAYPPFLWR